MNNLYLQKEQLKLYGELLCSRLIALQAGLLPKTGVHELEYTDQWGNPRTILFDYDTGRIVGRRSASQDDVVAREKRNIVMPTEKAGRLMQMLAKDHLTDQEEKEFEEGLTSGVLRTKEALDNFFQNKSNAKMAVEHNLEYNAAMTAFNVAGEVVDIVGKGVSNAKAMKRGADRTLKAVQDAVKTKGFMGGVAEVGNQIYGKFAEQFPAMDTFIQSPEFDELVGSALSLNVYTQVGATITGWAMGIHGLGTIGYAQMYKNMDKTFKKYGGEEGLKLLTEDIAKYMKLPTDHPDVAKEVDFAKNQLIKDPKTMPTVKQFAKTAGKKVLTNALKVTAVASAAITVAEIAKTVYKYNKATPEQKAKRVAETHLRQMMRVEERLKAAQSEEERKKIAQEALDRLGGNMQNLPKEVRDALRKAEEEGKITELAAQVHFLIAMTASKPEVMGDQDAFHKALDKFYENLGDGITEGILWLMDAS